MYFRYPIRSRVASSENAAREGKKMFECHDRLCWFETCLLRVGLVDDNGVTKFREVVTHGGVESNLALID
jgi:hypothetical protein